MTTREEWLNQASLVLIERIRPHVPGQPLVAYISVGWPKRGKEIGECWDGSQSQDGRPHVFISPNLAAGEPWRILDVLLHELIHAALGTKVSHRGPFVRVAKAVGLLPPWTGTSPSEALAADLRALAVQLGPYPHAALSRRLAGEKRPGSRLRLFECECEPPVKVRVARDEFRATCDDCQASFTKEEK